MTGDAPPLDEQDLHALLRLEVGTFRAGEQRRRFAPVVHLGRLGGPRMSVPVPALPHALDAALAFDVLDAALGALVELPATACGDRPPGRAAWLTRPGLPFLHDLDQLWLVAAAGVVDARGMALRSFHTITRTGWLDVRTGECRTWKRLRLDR